MPRKPKKDTGIFERPQGSGNWYVRYYDEFGRDRKKAAGTKTAAEALLPKLKEEARLRKLGLKPSAREEDRQRLTVGELIERYRPEFEAKKSARDYRRYAKVWTQQVGGVLVSDLRAKEIEAWRREAKLKGLKPNTINNHTSFLRRIFNLGIRDEILAINPVGNGRVLPLKGVGKRKRVITLEEETLLLPAMEHRDRVAFVLCLYVGLRRGEAMKIRRGEVDQKLRRLRLPDTKAGEEQWVELSDPVLRAIVAMLDSHQSEWLFPNKAGDGPATGDMFLFRLKKVAADLGLDDVLVHTLRHSFVTRVIAQGSSIGTAKDLARHSTITMTSVYLHEQDGARREAVDRLAAGSEHLAEMFPAPRPRLRLV